MEESQLKEIIRKYMKGKCTPAEHLSVRELMQDPKGRQLFDAVLNEGWPAKTDAEISAGQMKHWHTRFEHRLRQEQDLPAKQWQLPYTKFLRIAAVWLLICTTGYYGWHQLYTKTQAPVMAMRRSVTLKGKMMEVILTDGTRILMNSASTLRYPEKFTGKTREVYLQGEAFFKVAHDSAHPFIVHTPSLNVQVLGTSFNIKAYREDQLTALTVATGKVGVTRSNTADKNAQILLPGDRLSLDGQTGLYSRLKVNPDDSSSWQSGNFVFRNETLANISKSLMRRYDISFTFRNKALAEKRFDLNQRNDNLENIMKTLAIAGEFDYRISGKQVEIR